MPGQLNHPDARMILYDIPGIIPSGFHLAASSANSRLGFQLPIVSSSKMDIFHDEECMGGLTSQTELPLL
jgi:hypothetical protein